MGRANIITDLGEGEYTIKPVYDETLMDARIDSLTDVITEAKEAISEIEDEISDLQSDYRSKYEDVQVAIRIYKSDPDEKNLKALNTATQELNEIVIDLEVKNRELGAQKLIEAGATKEKTKLENLKSSITNKNVWSVDYTEGLSGEVNTIEVKGEPDTILVGDFTLGTSKLTEIFGQTVAGSLYNFALTPYWQKWNPTFRVGTITAMSGSTASVTLDAATSHYQNLNINQSETLTNVSFSYMDCDESAFTTSDEVIVAFTSQDWSTPVIIGFKDNPAECPSPIQVSVTDDTYQLYDPDKRIGWNVTDLGGQSPSINFELAETGTYFTRINYVNRFVSGAFKMEFEMDSYGVVQWTIDFSYNGGWQIRTKLSCPELPESGFPTPYRMWSLPTGASPDFKIDKSSPAYVEDDPTIGVDTVYVNRDAWMYYLNYEWGYINVGVYLFEQVLGGLNRSMSFSITIDPE